MAISLKSLFRNIKDTTEKVSKNKNLGKLIGASYFTKTPSLALADVGGKIGIKGLDNPFFKGAAQGSRMAMGTAALMGGAGLAGGSTATTSVAKTPANQTLFSILKKMPMSMNNQSNQSYEPTAYEIQQQWQEEDEQKKIAKLLQELKIRGV
jgi:hypothetical protein